MTDDSMQIDPPAPEQGFQLNVILPKSDNASLAILALPSVTIMDIRNHVIESSEGRCYTCFHLEFEGNALADTTELSSIPNFSVGSSLVMVPDPYNDREVRIQISRLREILSTFKPNASAIGIDAGSTFISTLSGDLDFNKSANTEDKSARKGRQDVNPLLDYDLEHTSWDLMAQLLPSKESSPANALDACLRSIVVSAWNPPPPARRLAGDIAYLAVTTVEGVVLHITCSVDGFYVSRSTDKVFDPLPRAGKSFLSDTLPGLLSQASLGFANRFALLQKFIQSRHPYELVPTPSPHVPWCVIPPPHEPDLSRSIDSYLVAADSSELLTSRDWNDELQTARELPRETPQDKVVREQLIHRNHADFVEAAIKSAMAITSGSVPALNPADPESMRMYLHCGIFFSQGNDQKDNCERFGGSAASHVSVGKDVNAVARLSSLDFEGVFTLGTAVIDYRGQRLLAQSLIPGILKKQQQLAALPEQNGLAPGADTNGETVIQYGSIDNGKSIYSDPKYHEIASQIAKALHLEEHIVIDGVGAKHSLYTSVDTKGITGNDARRYFIDLTRVVPTDIDFLGVVEKEAAEGKLPPYHHKMTLLRFELVELFYASKMRSHIVENYQKKKREEALAAGTEAQEPAPGESITMGPEDYVALESTFDFRFNPDAAALLPASPGVGGEDPESSEKEAQLEKIREITSYLTRTVIPQTVLEMHGAPTNCPVDGERLTKFLHARGINMRYLGRIAKMLGAAQTSLKTAYAKVICEQEILVRSAKSILRNLMLDVPARAVNYCIAHFLNCLIADPAINSTPTFASLPKRATPYAFESLTAESLDAEIRRNAQIRFRYELPSGRLVGERRLPIIRSLCLKVGIQLLAREHDWESGYSCFNAADVLNIYPIVKHSEPKSSFAEELHEHGVHSMRQGNYQVGLELFAEASAVCDQVYTPVHPESGKFIKQLAGIKNDFGDYEAYRASLRNSLITSERVYGFDDPDTVAQYMELSLIECAIGSREASFKYAYYALKNIEMLCAGTLHPQLSSTYSQIGMMLMHTRKEPTAACRFLAKAVSINEQIHGKEHEQTIASMDAYCQSLTLAGDHRAALDIQRAIYKFHKSRAGDQETEALKEAANKLQELTARAVNEAKRDIGSKSPSGSASPLTSSDLPRQINGGRAKSAKVHPPTAASAAGPKSVKANGAASTVKSGAKVVGTKVSQLSVNSINGNKGHLSVDELLKFIEDDGSKKKKKSVVV